MGLKKLSNYALILIVALLALVVNNSLVPEVLAVGPFSGGSGASNDPYQIANCADLRAIDDTTTYLSKSYVLTANIDCSASAFTPLINGSTYFSGVFDGDNFTISNVSISCTTSMCGIFARSLGATFQDFTLSNVTVASTGDYVGAIVGYAGVANSPATPLVQNFSNISTSNLSVSGKNYLGGLVGDCASCAFTSIQISGEIVGLSTSQYVGGIVGEIGDQSYNYIVQITSSSSSASVSGYNYVGGLVGMLYRASYSASHGVFSSYTTGSVTGSATATGGVIGQTNAGGLEIANTWSSASVLGGNIVGGVLGWARGTYDRVYRSYSTGTVENTFESCNAGSGGLVGSGDSLTVVQSFSVAEVIGVCRIGGLVGLNNGAISDSYFRGTVYRKTSTNSSVAGITSRGGGTITRSYVATTATINVGDGLAGDVQYSPSCTNSYWDTQVTGRSTSRCNATGKTTLQMKDQTTYSNWDFSTVWSIAAGVNDGYPTLQAFSGFSFDGSTPSATWTSPSSPSSSRTLVYTLTFSEAVSGIARGDFSNTGTATGCVFTPSSTSTNLSITVTVVCASDGTVIARLGANSVVDAALNTGPSSASNASSVSISVPASTTTTTTTTTPTSSTTTTVSPSVQSSTSTTTAVVGANTQTSTTVSSNTPGGPSSNSTIVTGSTSPTRSTIVTNDSVPGESIPPRTRSAVLSPATTTSTLPKLSSLDLPEVEVGEAAVLYQGKKIEGTISRENNELTVKVGPILARIWATAKDGGKVPLDAEGRLRLDVLDSVTVDVDGFDPRSGVEVRLYSDPILLGKSKIDAAGNLSAAYEIPETVESGDHEVVLAGTARGEDLTFSLSVAVGDDSDGAPIAWIIAIPLLGAIAIALILPVALRRRRRQAEQV